MLHDTLILVIVFDLLFAFSLHVLVDLVKERFFWIIKPQKWKNPLQKMSLIWIIVVQDVLSKSMRLHVNVEFAYIIDSYWQLILIQNSINFV